METFDKYAEYYDWLYEDKDYPREAAFVNSLIQHYNPSAKEILELGCGTGLHAKCLSDFGYRVHGIDFSEKMVNKAKKYTGPALSFSTGDMRNYRDHTSYDIVVSLFHVMCYLTSSRDLSLAFKTAREKLNHGGIFIFDCWYGPAVLEQRPAIRLKRIENQHCKIWRYVSPKLDTLNNQVDVNYDFVILDKKHGTIQEFSEIHRVRYFFRQEIELLATMENFIMLECKEWMTECEPSGNTWGVYFVLQGQ